MYKRRSICGIVLTVLIVSPVAFSSDTTRTASSRPSDTWEVVVHNGLMLYWQGQYKKVFQLIEEKCRSSKPGPGVHQALALMAKAYRECKTGEKIDIISTKTGLTRQSNEEKTTDVDIVLRAVLGGDGNRTTNVALLEKLMEAHPKSPWYDWAYWERARALGAEAYVGDDPLGVVPVRGRESSVACVVSVDPQMWIQGRAAEGFLESRPSSYMAATMREDVLRWRITVATWSLQALEMPSNAVALLEQQKQEVAKAQRAIRSMEELFPISMKRRAKANRRLNDFLWGSGDKWKIVDYFEALLTRTDGQEAVLEKDIRAWIEPLLKERRKQKAGWQRVDIQRPAIQNGGTKNK